MSTPSTRPRARTRKKPPTREAAVARTKGTDGAGVTQRWTLHIKQEDGSLGEPFAALDPGGLPFTIFVAARLWVDARALGRAFASRALGWSWDKIDDLIVSAYTPNGWTPPRAVLVSVDGDEYIDIQALVSEAGQS